MGERRASSNSFDPSGRARREALSPPTTPIRPLVPQELQARPAALAPPPRVAPMVRSEWIAIGLISAAGALLRFHALGGQSFWYDEAVSAALARAPLADLVTGRVRDLGNPPLYLVLLHVWTALAGASDASVRALSALTSAATIPLFFALARRLAERGAALLAAALLAASPFHVYLGQEARPYALAGFLGVASVLLLVRAVERPTSFARWSAWGLCAFAALWAHYSAGFLLLGEALWVVAVHRRDRRIVGGAIGALGFASALFATWLPALLAQLGTHGNLARSAETWYLHAAATPLAFAVGTTLAWKDGVSLPRGALAALGTAALAIPALAALSSSRRDATRLLPGLWVAVVVLVPLLVSLSLFPMYHVRYVSIALPAWLLLACMGLVRAPRSARAIALAAVALAAGASLTRHFGVPQKHDWRSAVAAVESRSAPGDLVLFDAGFNETAFAHYATLDRTRLRLAALEPERLLAARAAGARFEDVGADVAAHDRVWLILSDEGPRREARITSLARDRRIAQRVTFRGIEALLLVRPGAGGG